MDAGEVVQMAVHVDEVHTDVVPAVAPADQPGREPAPAHIGAAEETWRESHRATVMIARRTAAEGFDD
jgi:hypothetical protein